MRQMASKGPFWLFCMVMILLYYNGLAHPEKSDYWLARFGFAILILEFFSVFVVISLLEMTGKASCERPRGVSSFVVVLVSLLAFVFSWLTDIWSFVYFLIAIPTKFIAFGKMKTTEESREKLRSAVVSGSSMVLSALVGVFLAKKYGSAFHAQAQLLGQYLVDSRSSFGAQTDPDFLVFIGFWGMLHFASSILFDLGVRLENTGARAMPQNRQEGREAIVPGSSTGRAKKEDEVSRRNVKR